MRNFKQFKCQLQRKRGFKVPVICPYWSSKHDPRWMLIQDRWHSKGTITKSLYIFNTNKLSRYVVATLPILYNYNYCFICCGLGNKGVSLPALEIVNGILGVNWRAGLGSVNISRLLTLLGGGGFSVLFVLFWFFLSWWMLFRERRWNIDYMNNKTGSSQKAFYFLAIIINVRLISC